MLTPPAPGKAPSVRPLSGEERLWLVGDECRISVGCVCGNMQGNQTNDWSIAAVYVVWLFNE